MPPSVRATVAVGIAVLVGQLLPLLRLVKPFATVERLQDDSCKLFAAHLPNAEDLTLYRWGLVFVSAGNLSPLIGHSTFGAIQEGNCTAAGVPEGTIVLMDIRQGLAGRKQEPSFWTLRTEGLPNTLAFHPHGKVSLFVNLRAL